MCLNEDGRRWAEGHGGGEFSGAGCKMAGYVLRFDACVIYTEDTVVPVQERKRSGEKERGSAAT